MYCNGPEGRSLSSFGRKKRNAEDNDFPDDINVREMFRVYSGVPITRAGSIKRAGWKFHEFLLNEQVLIRASRVEKCIFSLLKWLRAGHNS